MLKGCHVAKCIMDDDCRIRDMKAYAKTGGVKIEANGASHFNTGLATTVVTL